MNGGVLRSENIHYRFNGHRFSFCVHELEDGYWGVECSHDLFCAINGSNQIRKADSVNDALKDVRNLNPALALAMQEAYDVVCRKHFEGYGAWTRCRIMYYHFN
jgi:hypothetical protein